MPTGKLLFSISIPIIISMIVQAMYNIVDSVFVAQFNNNEGTGALGLAFPIQNLLLAVSIGMAVGINALLSRSLGQKLYDKASRVAGQGFFLMGCGYLIFLIFGLFFTRMYADSQAGDNHLLADFTYEYTATVTIGSIAVFVQVLGERLLQATGKSVLSMITQASGAIVNIVLDPILIFTPEESFLGFGAGMGIFGAALATVIGQVVAAVIAIFLNLKYNNEIKIRLKNFIPNGELIKEILVISIPAIMMQAIGTVMTLCMNNILLGFEKVQEGVGETALNAFTIYFKLQSFVFMPIFGLNNGMVPILSYNYGARKPKRVFSTMKIAYICAVTYTILGLLVFQLWPEMLLEIFNATDSMLEIGSTALRTISWSFLFAGFSIISISTCQALGKSIYSLFVSVGRQLVILIPAAFLLSLTGNVDNVWWSFPIAELMSLLLCSIFLISAIKNAFYRHDKSETEHSIDEE